MRTSRRLVAALATAALAVPLLSGCSLVQQFLPDGGGDPLGGIIPTQSVPSSFPPEVPLIDGDVLLGIELPGESGNTAWNVTIKVGGLDAFDGIAAEMEGAGYTYLELASTEESRSGSFTKDPYTVIVVVAQADGAWNANYTVTEATG